MTDWQIKNNKEIGHYGQKLIKKMLLEATYLHIL